MKRSTFIQISLVLISVLCTASLTNPGNALAQSAGTTEGWPREIKSGDKTFRVHQPQLDKWDGHNVEALTAIELKVAGSDKPTYGAARLSASVEIDKVTRMVQFQNLAVMKVAFPSTPDDEGLYLRVLQNSVMPRARQMSLDRFETAVAAMESEQKFASFPLKNDPPKIIFSQVPAILVYIDGDPAYRPMKAAKVERVINCRPLIVRTADGKHYLRVFDGWMESAAIGGPWAVSQNPSPELEYAISDAKASGQVDLLEGKADPESKIPKPSLAKGPAPKMHIATAATELIVTEGEPRFVPIAGTALTYAENTTGNIFRHTAEGKLYVLISGRWFRSGSFAGPWEFVPGGKLPKDFPDIPDDSPKENVKASIPGTHQALEAVIASHIPQTATVNRKEIKLNPPRFDGEPQLKPLEGTSLQYVANTATPIIRIDAQTFYAVENGVWFKASSLQGPWIVADSVPGVIYSIPPSAPLHFVTYVKVYGSTPTTVDVGYTAGYYGTMVTTGSGYVAVYGTGYPYYPWVGTTWYGPPVTYGFGTTMCYTPWDGWSFSFGYGWSWGYPMYPYGWGWGPYPWYGPVGWGHYYPYPYYAPVYGGVAWGPGGAAAWGPGGWAATTGNVYHRYGNTGAVTRTSQGFNAWTGNQWARQVGTAYNSKTGSIAAGQRAAVNNVYTGNYAYGGRGTVQSGRTGETYNAGRITAGNSQTGQSGSAGYIRGDSGGIARVGDSIYAAHDGTVYRRGSGGWESNSGSGWSSVGGGQGGGQAAEAARSRAADLQSQGISRQSSSQLSGSLNRQADARSMGQTRTQASRSYSSGAGARAGGAMRGGGRR